MERHWLAQSQQCYLCITFSPTLCTAALGNREGVEGKPGIYPTASKAAEVVRAGQSCYIECWKLMPGPKCKGRYLEPCPCSFRDSTQNMLFTSYREKAICTPFTYNAFQLHVLNIKKI